jgi:hypothetical protein
MKTKITQAELIEMYEEMINECTEEMKIGHISFEASRVLKELDPIAYNCGLSDFYDSISDEYFCEEME